MFEKLPAPFGLRALWVAPDHEKIKNVIKVFEKTAPRRRFSFLVMSRSAKRLACPNTAIYDAVIFCYGTEADRRLGIPGETLTGSYTATEFVGWYNGHPKFQDRQFDFSHEKPWSLAMAMWPWMWHAIYVPALMS